MSLCMPWVYCVPEVPKSPECYAKFHPDRIKDVPEQGEVLVDPHNLTGSQDDGWRHELDHDVESVFWLLLYWAMVTQPEGGPGEDIDLHTWISLRNSNTRETWLVFGLSSDDM